MKTDNIQALKDVLAGFSKAETEFDNYINTTRATDPDAEEMTIQLMGLIITFGEILVSSPLEKYWPRPWSMSLQTRRVLNPYRRARSCSEVRFTATIVSS